MLDARSGDPEVLMACLFAEGFDTFLPEMRATALLPGYVFVNTDPEADGLKLSKCVRDAKFVTNEVNRPMCVPDKTVSALRDRESEVGRSLRGALFAMAPEYRLDFLRQWFHPAAIQS